MGKIMRFSITMLLALVGTSIASPCHDKCGTEKAMCAEKCRAKECPPHASESKCKKCMQTCERELVDSSSNVLQIFKNQKYSTSNIVLTSLLIFLLIDILF